MGKTGTQVSDLCAELGITHQTVTGTYPHPGNCGRMVISPHKSEESMEETPCVSSMLSYVRLLAEARCQAGYELAAADDVDKHKWQGREDDCGEYGRDIDRELALESP